MATTSPDPRPVTVTVGSTLRSLHWSVGRLLGRLESDAAYRVTREDLAQIERLARRVEAARFRMIARADAQDLRRGSGASSTSALVAQVGLASGARAARDVTLAGALESDLPATRDALAEGVLTVAAAEIIADTMTHLPEGLGDADKSAVEAALVRDGRTLPPGRLRRQALSALAAAEKSAEAVADHQEQVLLEAEERAYRRSHLTMHDRADGTTAGSFVVPTGAAHCLRKVLQSMTSPRRDHLRRDQVRPASGPSPREATSPGHLVADTSDPSCTTSDGAAAATATCRDEDWASLDWSHKRGRALVELLEHLDTDRLSGKVAATVVVTMTLEQAVGAAAAARLAHHIGAATGRAPGSNPSIGVVRTDTGHDQSTASARRLACQAGILPVVLGGRGVPLDVGRQERFFTDHQRTALAAIYDECAAHGCDRPYAWTELHHRHPWSQGGRTDIADAVPLCGYHHRTIHDPRLAHTVTVDESGRYHVAFDGTYARAG